MSMALLMKADKIVRFGGWDDRDNHFCVVGSIAGLVWKPVEWNSGMSKGYFIDEQVSTYRACVRQGIRCCPEEWGR